jgi:hypothetical protein
MRSTLEQRYRRLLAWYPQDHRDIYEDEMVGVLLETAEPAHTRPTVATAADLLAGAARYRLRHAAVALADRRWRTAASATSVLALLALVCTHLYTLTGELADRAIWPEGRAPGLGPSAWVPPLAWTSVAIGAVILPRLVGAGMAWGAVLFDLAVQTVEYNKFAGGSLFGLWMFLLGVIAAATLTAGTGARAGLRMLGGWRLGYLALIGVLVLASRWALSFYPWYWQPPALIYSARWPAPWCCAGWSRPCAGGSWPCSRRCWPCSWSTGSAGTSTTAASSATRSGPRRSSGPPCSAPRCSPSCSPPARSSAGSVPSGWSSSAGPPSGPEPFRAAA